MRQPSEPAGLWNRQFLFTLGQNTAFAAAFNGFVPILPLYLASLGRNDQEVGFIVGSYGLAALFLRPLSGRLTDQFGPKTISLVGAFFFCLSTPLMALTSVTPLLIALRIVQSGGIICFFTASTTLGVISVSPGRIGTAMGVLGVSGGVGAFISSPFTVQIAELIGWTLTLLLIAGMAVIAMLMCLQIKMQTKTVQARLACPSLASLVPATAIRPTLYFLGFTLTQGPILAFIPLLALDRGLGNPGLFFAALSIGNIISRTFVGHLADKYGRGKVILPGLLLTCLAMPAIAASHSSPWFLAAGLLYGIGNGMTFTALIAYMLDRISDAERGSAIATFQWGWDIGSSVSAAVMGVLVTYLGYGGIFLLSAVFPGTSALVFAFMRLKARRFAGQTA